MSGEEEKSPSSTQTPSSTQAPMSANSAPPPQPSTGLVMTSIICCCIYLHPPLSFVINSVILYVSSYPCRNLIDVDGSPTTNYSHSSVDSSAAVGKPSASMSTPSSSSSSSSGQYRGLRVELPFDFLRVRNPIDSHSVL